MVPIGEKQGMTWGGGGEADRSVESVWWEQRRQGRSGGPTGGQEARHPASLTTRPQSGCPPLRSRPPLQSSGILSVRMGPQQEQEGPSTEPTARSAVWDGGEDPRK